MGRIPRRRGIFVSKRATFRIATTSKAVNR
jgi:hypothetical protein